jgi:hypothetical protein
VWERNKMALSSDIAEVEIDDDDDEDEDESRI